MADDEAAAVRTQLVRTAVEVLEGTARHAETTISTHDGTPSAGSAAQREISADDDGTLDAPWMPRPGYDAHGTATLMILTAADHLRGHARVLLPEPPTIWAPRTIARASLENTARAAWLLDPAITYRDRVIRYVNDSLYSLWEARRAGFSLTGGRDPAERVEEIVAWANLRAIPVSRPKDPLRSPVGLGDGRRNATRVLDDLLDEFGKAAYREFSALAHATLSGLMNMVEPAGDGDDDRGEIAVKPEVVITVAATAFMVFMAGFERLLAQYGWSPDLSASWKLSCIRRMRPFLPRSE
ncbi:MAG TPA: hypothetical protein VFF40_09825 [Acidimicrobiia bacterium]|nr:hypothetical protein [Acidimicrobiia bacterium]